MRTAKCKCGEIQAWGEMPPCAICEKCGTAPGYVNAEKPTPHRFSKKFDQNTGKPFNFCMVCGRKEEVLFEPKCAECGKTVATDDIGFECETFVSCKACTNEVEEQWRETKKMLKEQGIDPDECDYIERRLAEPDATERARALVSQLADGTPDEMELYASIAVAFLESEAPQIRADERKKAVREFYWRVKKLYRSGRMSYGTAIEQVSKEMTEV